MKNQFLVILTTGKKDDGTRATLAFSCALSALSLGLETSVFLTGDGSVWGVKGSSTGIIVLGYPPLESLIRDFVQSEGKILLCSVCYRDCNNSMSEHSKALMDSVQIAGFTKAVSIANKGSSITF